MSNLLSREQFLETMNAIDEDLTNNSILMHQRPSRAFTILAKKVCPNSTFILSINKNIAVDDFSPSSLYTQVNRWYTEKYGDLIKIHMGPGKYVLMIKGEPWEVEYPKYFGTYAVSISNTIKKGSDNILCQVKKITPKIASELTDAEKQSILNEYMFGLNALELLSHSFKLPYMEQAKNDYDMAIENIFHKSPNYNNSKWSSLQFAEKTIKSKLEANNISFKHIHILSDLSSGLSTLGMNLSIQKINNIQCNAQVRYESNTVTRNEAILAIQSALALFVDVFK